MSKVKERMLRKLQQRAGPPKLCLAMIVRNEQNNMPRLLDSFLRQDGTCILDMACISDNGPAEETECERVTRAWFEAHRIPLAYLRVPWVNFSVNRTQNLQQARDAFPEASYFLLSDADFVWQLDCGGKRFDTRLLYADKYMVRQVSATDNYWNVRLLSRRCEWECRGSTHEYWAPLEKDEGRCRADNITSLQIDDREDGGYKQSKFVRDYALLTAEVQDPATIPFTRQRAHFYLGQTCWCLGKYAESIKWYSARLTMGGWIEEQYFAAYRVGSCYEALSFCRIECDRIRALESPSEAQADYLARYAEDTQETAEELRKSAKKWYRKATAIAPQRAEALYHLVRLLRVFGEHEEALALALKGAKLTTPNHTLFVDRWMYPQAFEMEVAYNAPLVGKPELGVDYAAKLCQHPENYPQWVLNDVKNIMPLYV